MAAPNQNDELLRLIAQLMSAGAQGAFWAAVLVCLVLAAS